MACTFVLIKLLRERERESENERMNVFECFTYQRVLLIDCCRKINIPVGLAMKKKKIIKRKKSIEYNFFSRTTFIVDISLIIFSLFP